MKLSEYKGLTEYDRKFYELAIQLNGAMRQIEDPDFVQHVSELEWKNLLQDTEEKRHWLQIQNPDTKDWLALYVDELEIDDEAASEEKYRAWFERTRNVRVFNEWCHFYTRHGHLEKTKELEVRFAAQPILAGNEKCSIQNAV